MKTKSIYIAALFLAGAFASCQKDPIGPDNAAAGIAKTGSMTTSQTTARMIVHYQVGVYQTLSKPMCGSYAIEITNSAGVPVAPAQRYLPTQVHYFFSEMVTSPTGIRIARLVESGQPEERVSCPNRLYAQPETQNLTFRDGKAYFFYLYPTYDPLQIPQ